MASRRKLPDTSSLTEAGGKGVPETSDGGLVGSELGRSAAGSGSLRDEFAHCLLCLVTVRPMSPYDVTRTLQSVIRHMWGAAESQVYSGLAKLEQQGLVISEEVANGRRARRVYSVTEAGRAVVEHWLGSVTPERAPKDVFLLKLFFMGESTDEAALAHLENRRTQLEASLAHGLPMRERYGVVERRDGQRVLDYQLLAMDFAIARTESELELVDRLIDLIKGGVENAPSGRERIRPQPRGARSRQSARKG